MYYYRLEINRKDAEYRDYSSKEYERFSEACEEFYRIKSSICTLCCYTEEQFWKTFDVAIYDSYYNSSIYLTSTFSYTKEN